MRVDGAEARDVDAVRGAEERVVAVGELRSSLLEHGEDRAAVVVDHRRRSGRVAASRGPSTAPSCRAGTSRRPSARAPWCCAVGRARRRSRWRRCRRCRRGRGSRSPCGGRRPGSAPPSGRGRGSGWTRRRRGGRRRERSADGAGDLVRREVGLRPQQRVQLAADRAVRGHPGVEPAGVGRLGGRGPGNGVIDPERAVAPEPDDPRRPRPRRRRGRGGERSGATASGGRPTTTRSTWAPRSPASSSR